MRLSEAIRLGAMTKPQGSFGFFKDGRTCALGAALDAAGRLIEADGDCQSQNYRELARLWPFTETSATHPIRRNLAWRIYAIVEHLNDTHKWTREQIADWVETIERAQDSEALQALSLVGVGIES